MGTATVKVVEPATRSLHAACAEAIGTGGHMLSDVQVVCWIEHLPAVTSGRQSLLAVHDLAVSMLHVPGSGGQSLTELHASAVLEQV